VEGWPALGRTVHQGLHFGGDLFYSLT